jgi:hypothetical protein
MIAFVPSEHDPLHDLPAAWRPARLPWQWDEGGAREQASGGGDPFEDFDDDDFDDEFDDDFEEDWEDDLTEDDEFPDTFGGEDDDPDGAIEQEGESPFSDDPDFDDD